MSMERIQRDAQKADQMIAEMGRSAQGDEPVVATDPEGAESTTSDEGLENTAVDDQGTAQNDPGVSPDTAASDAERWKAEAEKQEQRYRSLNGMIEARDRQIQQLHDLLAGMSTSQSQSSNGAQEHPETSSAPLITRADEDAFGDDMIDMSRRAAREEITKFSRDLQRQFDDLRNELKGVSKTAQVSAQESFETKLDRKVTEAKWRDLNEDPLFIEWLNSSPARKQVWATAVTSKDADTAAEFFNDYAKLNGLNAEAERESPAQSKQQELERQVAPGKAKKTAAPETRSGDKKVWKRSEIVSAFQNKRQIPAEEFTKLEREIAAAQREGRVDYAR